MVSNSDYVAAVDEDDDRLLAKARHFLDLRSFGAGVALLRERLTRPLPANNYARGLLLGNLGALLIDLGAEGHDELAVREAINLYGEYRPLIQRALGLEHYYYNLANAKKSIFDAERRQVGGWNLNLAKLQTEAKNQYWQMVRQAQSLTPEMLVNLANSLSTIGRVSEALYWYDQALLIDPSHPMAHGNRSDCLTWMHMLSSSYSISMLAEICRGYERAYQDPRMRPALRPYWMEGAEKFRQALARHGHTLETATDDHTETLKEMDSHSDYRMFCIREHLMLSEHALYCPCLGARRDDLTIPQTQNAVTGDYVPAMELLLNRMKAEFNMSRLLYYQSGEAPESAWETSSFEGTYTDLLDEAEIDVKTEMLRTAFRLCFGILDRVAFGICSLFEIANPRENLYFHLFWKKKNDAERWEKLNDLSKDYPSLIALYSQATDFHGEDAEWTHLRVYRNTLEHELLILGPSKEGALGPYANSEFFKRLEMRTVDEFRQETLHLLRFVSSAILNFTLLVRQHALHQTIPEGAKRLRITLDKKPVGPE